MTGNFQQIKKWLNNNAILSPFCYRIYYIYHPLITYPKIYYDVIRLIKKVENNEDQIEPVQRKLLTNLLKHALINVPYYKKRVKVDPLDINHSNVFEILEEFPYISKEIIMKYPKEFISVNIDFSKLHYSLSGGTTGRGVRVWKTKDFEMIMQAFIDFNRRKCGWKNWSRRLSINHAAIKNLNGLPYKEINNKLLVSPHDLNNENLPSIVKKIKNFHPDFIRGNPSALEILGRYLKEKNIRLKCKGISLSYEAVLPVQIKFFQEVFNAPVYVEYGLNEAVITGMGCFNGKELHYHFNPIYGIVENLQDEHGNYELVGTGLWNYAMPLIRYRTKDFGKITKLKTKCPICGKKWKTAYELEGREQEFLITKKGTVVPGLSVVSNNFSMWNHIKSIQYVQNEPGSLELHIVPRGNLTKEVKDEIYTVQFKKLFDLFNIVIVRKNHISLTKAGKKRMIIVNHNYTK